MAETDKKDLPKYLRCNDCGWSGSTFRMGCPNCWASHLVELESSGIGKIVDLVPVFYPPENLKDLGPYVSVLVEFDEGFQMLGISLVKPEDLSIGSSVVVSSFDKGTMRLLIKLG
ncbi:MAG: Zn-ribbon domain-containing OB-fold protein [Desulfomonilaceae bacterium]